MKNRSSLLIAAYLIISAIVAFNPSIAKADVHVYDNNNQELGILLDLNHPYLTLLLPSLDASLNINFLNGDQNIVSSYPNSVFVYFDSANCSGTPYMISPLPTIFDYSSLPWGGIKKPDYNSKRTFSPGSGFGSETGCIVGGFANDEYIPLTPVELPFTIPIALPLRFEVETETVTQTEIMPFPIVVTPKNK